VKKRKLCSHVGCTNQTQTGGICVSHGSNKRKPINSVGEKARDKTYQELRGGVDMMATTNSSNPFTMMFNMVGGGAAKAAVAERALQANKPQPFYAPDCVQPEVQQADFVNQGLMLKRVQQENEELTRRLEAATGAMVAAEIRAANAETRLKEIIQIKDFYHGNMGPLRM